MINSWSWIFYVKLDHTYNSNHFLLNFFQPLMLLTNLVHANFAFQLVYHRFAPCFSVLQLNHDIVWYRDHTATSGRWCIPVVYRISFSCWSDYVYWHVEGMTSHTNQPLILKTHGIWSMTPCNFDHWVVPLKLTEMLFPCSSDLICCCFSDWTKGIWSCIPHWLFSL